MKNCKKNVAPDSLQKKAFQLEKNRQKLAFMGELSVLNEKYKQSLPEIKNLNTSKFWDQRIDARIDHGPGDGMTRERVDIAYKFMPKRAMKVLDIGAGYGYIEKLLCINPNIEIFGNDISPNAIENLQKRFKGKFKLESLYKMKYKSEFFDAIFMLEVLEHVPPSKTFGLLADIKRMLKKRGYLILSVPMNEGLEEMKDNPNGHVRIYTQALIKAELEIADYDVLSSKMLYAFNTHYMLKKLISKISRNRWQPNNIVLLAQVK
jgi:2-polyprenyl-3-methyl-5-hydroxy-6-metoxy-1,4-benzoquinol methylase